MRKIRWNVLLAILLVFALVAVGCSKNEKSATPSESASSTAPTASSESQEPEIPTIPQVKVSFGHEPYGDHTQAIIGLKQGWFEEVGITFDPPEGKMIPGENTISVFASGEVDVISGSVPLFLGASKQLPSFKYFFHADMFMGYALMAQPDKGFKSVEEFMDEGLSQKEAIQKAVEQMRGNKFGYPAETAIKGFIDLMLASGGLTLNDVTGIVAEDSRTSAMMVAGDLDFQVGGVPSRLTLEAQGFKPIVTSAHLAASAEPSPDSVELLAVFHDGWGATDKWIEENYDTMLRMASVGWRINQFINDHEDEAIAIHMPFLNKSAGTNFDAEVFKVIYRSLDPFLTFEQQNDWYNNDANPMNEKYVIGSHIKSHEEKNVFEPGEVTVEDFSIATKVYNEMVQYKQTAEAQIAEAEGLVGDDTPKANELLDQAKKFYDGFNFFDASRFSKAAIEWAQFEK